jgi:16S rRNA processing protein RimM
MSLVVIGRIGRIHGLQGEMILQGSSLDAAELRQVGSFVWRSHDGTTVPLTLRSTRPIHRGILVAFAEAPDRDRAVDLAGGELLAERTRLPDAGPGLAYTFELIGLEVRDVSGRRLGTLEAIWNTGAHPIYVVQGERELLVPAHPGVLIEVDRAAGVITVDLPAGLEDI